MKPSVPLQIASACANTPAARRLAEQFDIAAAPACEPFLRLDEDGLALHAEGQVLMGDFSHMLPRLSANKLGGELLVRTAKIKGAEGPLTAVDGTAGLGEDSLLLAAAGFQVTLFEHNPVIHALLADALERAAGIPELASIVNRMHLIQGNSVDGLKQLTSSPDVILLDPMFPARQKSALVKKKLQMIQKLEIPCAQEEELLLAAMGALPKKLIIKRPPKGPFLANVKPDYSITGKAVRYDCIVSSQTRLDKWPR